MSSVTTDSFSGLVARALERMAFVVTEPLDEDPRQVLADCEAHAAVDLQGVVRYQLAVAATAGLIRGVASGMLGLDALEIDLQEHAQPTVAELANVFGGELIMLLTAGDSQTSLALPRDVDGPTVRGLLEDAAAGFAFVVGGDHGRLLVVARRR